MRAISAQTLVNIARAALAACALAAAPAQVRAEEPAAPRSDAALDSTTVYDFDDDQVFGATTQPQSEVLVVRRRGQREGLIRAREHFIRELLHSVEQL